MRTIPAGIRWCCCRRPAPAHADRNPPGLFRIVTANGFAGNSARQSFATKPKVAVGPEMDACARKRRRWTLAGGVHQLSVIQWPDAVGRQPARQGRSSASWDGQSET